MSEIKFERAWKMEGIGYLTIVKRIIKRKEGFVINDQTPLEHYLPQFYDVHISNLRHWLKTIKDFGLIDFKSEGGGYRVILTKPKRNVRPKPEANRPTNRSDVYEYMKALGVMNPALEAEKFLDYWEERDWHRKGNVPIRDWQATCRRWVRNSIATTEESSSFKTVI